MTTPRTEFTIERDRPWTPAEQLAAYRSRHVISAVTAFRGLPRDPYCKVDRIRVIQRRSGHRPLLWRHDPDEIKRLVKAAMAEATRQIIKPPPTETKYLIRRWRVLWVRSRTGDLLPSEMTFGSPENARSWAANGIHEINSRRAKGSDPYTDFEIEPYDQIVFGSDARVEVGGEVHQLVKGA